MKCVMFVLALLTSPGLTAFAADPPPSILTWSVGARMIFEDGEVHPGVIWIEFECALGQCSLTRTHLFECDGNSWTPFSITTNTKDGHLRILSSEIHGFEGEVNGTLLVEERYVAVRYHYRFDYKALLKRGEEPLILGLTGLEGDGAVYVGSGQGNTGSFKRYKMVPLRGKKVKIEPSCNLILRGILDDGRR